MKRCSNCNVPMMEEATSCPRCHAVVPSKQRASESVLSYIESNESGEQVVREVAKRQTYNAVIWLIMGIIEAVVLVAATWQAFVIEKTGRDMISVVVVISIAIIMNLILNIQSIQEAKSYIQTPKNILQYYENFGTLTFPMIYNGFLLVSGILPPLQILFWLIFAGLAAYYMIGVRGYVLRHEGQLKRLSKLATGDL